MNYSKIVFPFVLLLFFTGLLAGPFGLEMGMSLEDIGSKPIMELNGAYMFKEVPKPHSAFIYYVLTIAPKGGLYTIGAVGNTITSNPSGFQLKKEFGDLKEALEKNYGKCVPLDVLSPGSIWDEPGDWMMSLYKKHRIFLARWGDEAENSSLPPDLEMVTLTANATSSESGFILLRYDFINSDSCRAKISTEEDSSL